MRITRCPKLEICPSVCEFLRLVDWARDGHFPMAGGVNDQPRSFMSACKYLWAQEAEIEAEQRKRM